MNVPKNDRKFYTLVLKYQDRRNVRGRVIIFWQIMPTT